MSMMFIKLHARRVHQLLNDGDNCTECVSMNRVMSDTVALHSVLFCSSLVSAMSYLL